MSQSDVSIRYTPLWARVCLKLVKLCVPFWGMLPLFIAGFVLCLSVRFFSWQAVAFALLFILMPALMLFAQGVILLALLSEDLIIINEKGLRLPFSLFMPVFSPRTRSWPELIGFHVIDGSENNRYLLLRFWHGPPLAIKNSDLSAEDFNRMLLACQIFSSPGEQPESGGNDEEHALPILHPDSIKSFTNFWEAEYDTRFRPTNFIPLLPEHILQEGRIRIVRPLAYGGSAAIYLARLSIGAGVVLKEFIPAYVSNEARKKALELFQREARLLTKVDHPDIAKVHDYFIEDERHYLVLEHIRGEDLRRIVQRRGPQREFRTLRLCRQIAELLEYLHSRKPAIIHRDLTPENLVLRSDGRLALIDFGAANEFLGTATGTIIGKQAYIAPEQFRGKTVSQSDIYALGCTLHFLLTGTDPEPLTVSRPKDIRPDLSDSLNDLVMQMTQQSPELRPCASKLIGYTEKIHRYCA
ncbi:MAG TPA: serine/threonine-protein kinase [Candidatus Obscuribacterales bacterium]